MGNTGSMNHTDAVGFVGVGMTMLALPFVAPGWVDSASIYGPEGRAWWLFGMGTLNTAGGLGYLTRGVWQALVRSRAAAQQGEEAFEPAPVWAREIAAPAPRGLRAVQVRRAQA